MKAVKIGGPLPDDAGSRPRDDPSETTVTELFINILIETLRTLVLAAPFLLFGLLVAGFLHVLMPASVIQRWMGRKGLSGVTMAALIGVPLPVCSCGVVPISVELRRKGASPPSSLSFLTTTPESSIDSIFFTYALMGPVLAIARPVAAFFTALIGGVLAIAYLGDELPPETEGDDAVAGCGHDHCHDHDHGDGHDHSHSVSYSAAPEALAALRAWFGRRGRRSAEAEGGVETPGVWQAVVRPALRYGFGELLDDLAFWLLIGVLLAGILGAVLPADLGSMGLGIGILPMLLMLVVGIPIYMCASASTPIAAALMAKGISPGAALVFLLAGPATNAATLVLLTRTFGRRFVKIYLASVVVGALLSGIALDALAGALGWQVMAPLVEGEGFGTGWIEWFFFLVLAVLLLASFRRGAWAQGWAELKQGFAGMGPATEAGRRRLGRRLLTGGAVLAVLAWLASGLYVVPLDSKGYSFRFGALVARDLEPGLHFAWPAPIGSSQTWRTDYARKADIGFRTDLQLVAKRRELMRFSNPDEWHSTVAAMNPDPEQATFLTADENLLEMSFSVHYGLTRPDRFFYGLDRPNDLVESYAEACARQLLAGQQLEDLLTVRRAEIEEKIHHELQARLDELDTGIFVDAVRVVDIHPPGGAVFAFRDVSSATEDKQTRIHRAFEARAREEPTSRGEAAIVVAEAGAEAASRATEAAGRAEAFVAEAEAVRSDRALLQHLLWLETLEEVLPGREKIIVPGGAADGTISLWQSPPEKP